MKYIFFILLIILTNIIFAQQDSLFLIHTIVGQDTENPIRRFGSIGDINGDNSPDFFVAYPKYAKIYLGNTSSSIFTSITITPPDTADVDAIRLFSAGDINKDGYDDFVLSVTKALGDPPFPKNVVYFYFGGDEIDTISVLQYEDFCLHDALGVSAGGGDVNGDGFDDVLIGNSYNWCDAVGRVHLFYGNYSLSDTPDLTFESDALADFFGESLCSDGDINGDGFDDIIISAPNFNGNPDVESQVHIFWGDKSISTEPAIIITNSVTYVIVYVFSLPGFNGDEYSDFFLTSENKLYLGANEFDEGNYIKFRDAQNYDNFGESAGYAGDINRDGFSDLIIGSTGYKNGDEITVGAVYIYLGGYEADTIPDYFLEGETNWSRFGFYSGTLGDLNNDGYDEFYVVAPSYPDTDNILGKVYIYSKKNFVVGVEHKEESIPDEFYLYQNYPNPFNPSTKINYELQESGFVSLKIFNAIGEMVGELVNEQQGVGVYSVDFNASHLPSGVYIYKISVNSKNAINFSDIKKMVLLR